MCDKQDFSLHEVMQSVATSGRKVAYSAGELDECCVHTVIL
jgi:hypothetical protein